MNFVEPGFVENGYFIRDSDTQGNFRFDGFGKFIFINAGVSTVNVADMYSRWIDWVLLEDNMRFKAALRYSGNDPIPGGFTGTTFFTMNGWRVIYDANSTAINGVLFSEDFQTAYWSAALTPIYPATVSSLVNNAVSYQNVVTGTALTPEQTAAAVWGAAIRTLTSSEAGGSPQDTVDALIASAQFKQLLTVSKFLALKD